MCFSHVDPPCALRHMVAVQSCFFDGCLPAGGRNSLDSDVPSIAPQFLPPFPSNVANLQQEVRPLLFFLISPPQSINRPETSSSSKSNLYQHCPKYPLCIATAQQRPLALRPLTDISSSARRSLGDNYANLPSPETLLAPRFLSAYLTLLVPTAKTPPSFASSIPSMTFILLALPPHLHRLQFAVI